MRTEFSSYAGGGVRVRPSVKTDGLILYQVKIGGRSSDVGGRLIAVKLRGVIVWEKLE